MEFLINPIAPTSGTLPCASLGESGGPRPPVQPPQPPGCPMNTTFPCHPTIGLFGFGQTEE